MREEALGVTQEGTLRLHAPKLLEEGQSDDLRIREVFEGFVAVRSLRVESGVGVIYEAEEHGLRASSRWSRERVCWGWAI